MSLAVTTKKGVQPIHISCEKGHLKVAQWLANEGGVSLTAEDMDSSKPVHFA